MKQCEDCLAYYNKDHTCPPFLKALVAKRKVKCKTCGKPILKPKKYCSRECYRETLKKRASKLSTG